MDTTSQKNICRICGMYGLIVDRTFPVTSSSSQSMATFMLCTECGSILGDESCILNYAQKDIAYYSGDHELRNRLSLEAGYLFYLTLLNVLSQQTHGPKRFLEIGGGFGALSHMAKLLLGWDVVNSDPTERSAQGGKALGIEYLHGFVDATTFENSSFDVIFATEVVEHVTNPDAFIKIIQDKLKPGGLVLLTTPNAEVIHLHAESVERGYVESYCPGQHYTIFSAKSLEMVLHRNGFVTVKTLFADGSSGSKRLITFAYLEPETSLVLTALPPVCVIEQDFERYCHLALGEPTRNDWHAFYKSALKLRMFEQLVNQGKYDESDAWVSDFEAELAAKGLGPSSLKLDAVHDRAGFLSQYPTFIGKYYFYKGICLLNGSDQHETAASFSLAACELLQVMYKLGVIYSLELAGLAALHASLALERLGRVEEARTVVKNALSFELPTSTRLRLLKKTIELKTFPCRICGSTNVVLDREIPASYDSSIINHFSQCLDCHTLMDIQDINVVYEDIHVDDAYIRLLLMGSGFSSFASIVHTTHAIVGNATPIRFLDIGGGFGISAHMVKILYGWDAMNADPSSAAHVGGEVLGINHICGYIDKNSFSSNPFDVIMCSEVIEHVDDPLSFLEIVKSNLKYSGLLLLTTPNAESISLRQGKERNVIAAYGASQHCNIFSQFSLEFVLRKSGFTSIVTQFCGGDTEEIQLRVIASQAPNHPLLHYSNTSHADVAHTFIEYGRAVLSETRSGITHKTYKEAVQFRLFEALLNANMPDRAQEVATSVAQALTTQKLSPDTILSTHTSSIDAWLSTYPLFLGHYYYYFGILSLNKHDTYHESLALFKAAVHVLCQLQDMKLCGLEDMLGQAFYHYGLALQYLNREDEAQSVWVQALSMNISDAAKQRIADMTTSHSSENPYCTSSCKPYFPGHLQSTLLKTLSTLARTTQLATPAQVAKGAPLVHKALADYAHLGQLVSRVEQSMRTAERDYPHIRRLGSELERVVHTIEADYPNIRRLGTKTEQGFAQLEQDYPKIKVAASDALDLMHRTASTMGELNLLLGRLDQTAESVRDHYMALQLTWNKHRNRLAKTLRIVARAHSHITRTVHLLLAPVRIVTSVGRTLKRGCIRVEAAFLYPALTACGTRIAFPPPKAWTDAPVPDGVVPFDTLLDDCHIEQEFVAQYDALDAVSVFFKAEAIAFGSTVVVSLLRGTTVLASRQVSSRVLCSGSYTRVQLPTTGGLLGQKLRLVITVHGAGEDDLVRLWCRKTRNYGGMQSNGKPVFGAALSIGQIPPLQGLTHNQSCSVQHNDILIITPGELGTSRIGLAMRHWEIATALVACGKRVTLASTQKIKDPVHGEGFTVLADGWQHHAAQFLAGHGAVLTQGGAYDAVPELQRYSGLLLIDLVTPYHIEELHRGDQDFVRGCESLERMLERGDAFVCGNDRQRIYWMGMLTSLRRLGGAAFGHCASPRDATGRAVSVPRLFERDPDFRSLIDVVAFGVREARPVKNKSVLKGVEPGINTDDFIVMWFGGIWDWLDPQPLLQAVEEAHAVNPRIKLYFSMYRLPDKTPTRRAVETRKFAEQHNMIGRNVFFHEFPVSFAERDDYLLESDLGIFVQTPNFETTLSARTRVYDYIWAGLIPLMNEGDELADVLKRTGSGFVIPDYSVASLRKALLEAAGNPALREQTRAHLQQLRERMLWTKQIAPILKHLEGGASRSMQKGEKS